MTPDRDVIETLKGKVDRALKDLEQDARDAEARLQWQQTRLRDVNAERRALECAQELLGHREFPDDLVTTMKALREANDSLQDVVVEATDRLHDVQEQLKQNRATHRYLTDVLATMDRESVPA